MSERVKDMLLALKARLQNTPYPVYLGREFFDDDVDAGPMISVFFSKDGEKSLVTDLNELIAQLQEQELNLVIECHDKVDRDDPLLDLEDMHTTIKSALFDVENRRLAKGKIVKLKRRRSIPPERGSQYGRIYIEIVIPFHEEY